MPERFIGTAGWAVPRAHADRFARDGSGLQRYASRLNAAEINSSFYRSHKPETWARWAASVPSGFRFAVKMPRTISHERQLRGVKTLLRAFLEEVLVLGDALGPLLLQLPPKLAFEPRAATSFFDAFRALSETAMVCEPRHCSWASADADAVLRRFCVARVAADPPRAADACEPGGWPGLVYYRMHGSPRPYFSPYPADEIQRLAAELRRCDTPAWCIFDNTGSGAAAGNALDLAAALCGTEPR